MTNIRQFTSVVKKEEQQQEEGEVHEEEEEAQDNVQAELNSHNGDSIATNIKVKEVHSHNFAHANNPWLWVDAHECPTTTRR